MTDAQVAAIERRGYLRLEEDILYPLLTKAANYWAQLLTPEYYTSADGSIHYEKGKTALGEGESYCIVPSYSPEIIRIITPARQTPTAPLILLLAGIIWKCCFP